MIVPHKRLNVLSLFSGIGGLELGLERSGMHVVGQVEIDSFCRSVLDARWPNVPKHDDVRTSPAWWLREERPNVDVIAGGFPCQPFSVAGKWGGTNDDRWGWPWMFEAIRAVRPRYVLVENVASLLKNEEAFSQILTDLSSIGFDAEWHVVSACSVGAPHVRKRLFIVAYPNSVHGCSWLGFVEENTPLQSGNLSEGAWVDRINGVLEADGYGRRVADGVSKKLESSRVRALGNAVVPQVGELIGKYIISLNTEKE